MNAKLSDFIKNSFADFKSDLFSAFVVKCTQLAKSTGYTGFLTPYVWMFIKSYEKLRSYIYSSKTIETLIQFEYSAFEEATVPICTFVLKNSHVNKNGCYFRLTDFRGGMEVQRQKTLEAIADHKCGYYYESNSENFSKILGMPVAYWVSEAFVRAFAVNTLGDIGNARSGLQTGNNDLYLKYWHEASYQKIAFNMLNKQGFLDSKKKWTPQIKGGEYRKWYGNFDYIVNWENDGKEIRSCKGCRLNAMGNDNLFFIEGLTWSHTISSIYGARFLPTGFLFNVEAPTYFVKKEKEFYVLAFLNSCVAQLYLNVMNSTMHYLLGNIMALPIIEDFNDKKIIKECVSENIKVCKEDWDSFETSWDFEGHPLI